MEGQLTPRALVTLSDFCFGADMTIAEAAAREEWHTTLPGVVEVVAAAECAGVVAR